MKFLRQDLKYLFEVKGENQFPCYFFLLYAVKHVVCYQRLGFFLCSLLFVCYHMVGDVITFSATGWKKTKERKDQEKNVLDLILKLTNMA